MVNKNTLKSLIIDNKKLTQDNEKLWHNYNIGNDFIINLYFESLKDLLIGENITYCFPT